MSYFGAAYGPDTLKLMANALDAAWADAQSLISGLSAKEHLPDMASAVLEAAASGVRDAERLRQAALRGLACGHSLTRH
jgi:hypothetical protein